MELVWNGPPIGHEGLGSRIFRVYHESCKKKSVRRRTLFRMGKTKHLIEIKRSRFDPRPLQWILCD